MPPCSNATIVLRCAGERTAEVSRLLLEAETSPQQVVAISEVPFFRAVRRTIEIGLEAGRPWTIAVDADVLVRRGAVADLVRIAEGTPESIFKVEGRIYDKLFGGPRSGGLHLYRTSLLKQALRFTQSDQPVHRPEYNVVRQMRELGFSWQLHQMVLGLHDFEQSYPDLFRKGFVHAQKHAEFLWFLQPLWERLAGDDPDYRAVLLGAREGKLRGGIACTDVREFNCRNVSLLEQHGLATQGALDPEVINLDDVAGMLQRLRPTAEFQKWEKRRRREELRGLVMHHTVGRLVPLIPRPVRLEVKRLLSAIGVTVS